MNKILFTFLFIFISILTKAYSLETNDLKKLADDLKKEITSSTSQNLNQNNNNSNQDKKFLRKVFFCPRDSNTASSIVYNVKSFEGEPTRCRSSMKKIEYNQAKLSKDLKWCYAVRTGNWPPEVGVYFKDQNSGKTVCSPLVDKYFSNNSFLNSGPLNFDVDNGTFDVRNIISDQKNKKDENNEDLQVKLQLIFGLISEDQYKTSLASTQKKENLPSLLKIDLFGIKLGDQISNYKLINKQLEPNWSYYLYPSTEEYISDKGILINVFTFGGNGFKKKDQYDGKFHAIYNSLQGYKKKGYSEMMTMMSKYDHQYIEPVRSNKNFENYIVKFDPITKQVLAVMAKQKSTSKEECELSGMIEWRKKFGNYFVKKMSENGLITQYENRTILGIFDQQPNHSSQVSNVIAGFGQICADNGMFGKDKWIYLINLADEPEYLDNLYSLVK